MTEQYVYGVHAVTALLANRYRSTRLLFVNSDRRDKRVEALENIAVQNRIPIETLSSEAMNQRFAEYVHQGVVALAETLPEYGERDLVFLLEQCKKPCLVLILDGITDPHNLGACLRSADGAGVDFVVIPKDKNASVTPIVSKVACGALESMPLVRVTNLARAMDMIKQQGVWIYGAAGEESQSLYDLDCESSLAIVMGAEDKGIRHLTRERCDGLFALPMLGSVTSLNVSVATGVCLYEVVRKRVLKK